MKVWAVRRTIHSWGGLGSQLYAFSFLREMQRQFPRKKFIIIHHTSGVTRRPLEIKPLLLDGEVLEVEDYRSVLNSETSTTANGFTLAARSPSLMSKIKQKIKFSIEKLRLVEFQPSLNFNSRYRNLPISFRGHYSDLSISSDSLVSIWEFISEKCQEVPQVNSHISLHYRRGDLTESIGKIPISASRIGYVLNQAGDVNPNLGIRVYSDSGSEALEIAKNFSGLSREFEAVNVDILTTMFGLITSLVFIGTPSKISFWVAMIRIELFPDLVTYMPCESITNLNLNYKVSRSRNRLFLY